ncbi:MAG: MoxR family ATPase [Elusimicrobia bacterium]|nr:MoxR family ATPase [Candidatus Obscuribacterium magneticum]
MTQDIRAINDKVRKESLFVEEMFHEIGKVIVGQRYLLERLLVGLFADGHILLEGVPGLAKTLAVRTLAHTIDAKFQRIQFTPDLLPSDLIGTLIYNPKTGDFSVKKGPVFANIILADEINRAPAKVQSALLEAMQERQVTIGETTHPLPSPFLVLATQNPIEQEGTYPLPEAQIDRFMLKISITYPNRDEEKVIMERKSAAEEPVRSIMTPQRIDEVRSLVKEIYMDEKIKGYILDLVFATREPSQFNLKDMKELISYGASPRASIALAICSKAYAFIKGRGYVTPEDVKSIGPDVLRHRIIPSFEAEAENKKSDDLLRQILDAVEVP